jgi:hypothetical protein
VDAPIWRPTGQRLGKGIEVKITEPAMHIALELSCSWLLAKDDQETPEEED